jgi:tellurite resistance protein
MIEIENNENGKVIQNSDYLYKTDVEWIQEVPYTPITEFEIKMLEGTLNPEQLINEEQKEEQEILDKPIFLTDEEIEERERRDYITRVKVIALRACQRPILTNPSFLKQVEKNKIIKAMQYIIDTFTKEEIIEKFNEICGEEIFTGEGDDYQKYPIIPK